MDQAGRWLVGRGFTRELAAEYRIGFVQGAYSSEHESAEGCVSIPYLSHAGVVALRFRRIDDAKPKYWQPHGSRPWIYNVKALQRGHRVAVICEGEIDAIIADHFTSLPAVGLAGVNAWRPEFARCFDSTAVVLVAADGDDAGRGMVERLCKELPQARDAQMPDGSDVNKFFLEHGAEALTDYLRERSATNH